MPMLRPSVLRRDLDAVARSAAAVEGERALKVTCRTSLDDEILAKFSSLDVRLWVVVNSTAQKIGVSRLPARVNCLELRVFGSDAPQLPP